jgi:dihydrofolate reductase
MRKVIFLMHVSLDGLVAGPNGEMDWIVYNDDVEKYSHDLHSTTDTAIYGRVTYEMMNGYWPTVLDNPDSTPGELAHGRWYRDATKLVFSRKLDKLEGSNTVLIKDNIADEMATYKRQPGQDIWLLGSPTLAQTFMRLGLIDEYRLNVNPVVLGAGKPLFADDVLKLKLLESLTFSGGVVALRYEPERSESAEC